MSESENMMQEGGMTQPTPGSGTAVAHGCTCPVLDNGRGRGAYQIDGVWQFWVAQDCPLHGKADAKEKA